jgi:hypothetical protein
MPDILYHYTSMSTLQSILNNIEGDYLTFRATDIKYMNDVSEGEIATEILKESLINYENNLPEKEKKNISKYLTSDKLNFFKTIDLDKPYHFIFSLSQMRDFLPMWNTYADKSLGVAIGFKKELFSEVSYPYDFELQDCDYNQEDIKYYIESKISEIYKTIAIQNNFFGIFGDLKDVLWGVLKKSVPILKHHTFSYEKETRLVLQNPFNLESIDSHFKSIDFNIKNGLPKPFLEFKMPKSSIGEIIIGPCVDYELASHSLFRMLKKAGIDSTKSEFEYTRLIISKSDCKYREI